MWNRCVALLFAPVNQSLNPRRLTTVNSPTDIRLTETDVQAFADGRLASERADRLQAYLAERPDEIRRIVFYDRLNTQLRAMFGEDRIPPAVRRRTVDSRAGLVAAIVACVSLMIAAIWVTVLVPDAALERAAVEALSIDAMPPVSPPRTVDAPDLSSAGFSAVDVTTVTLSAFCTVNVIAYRNANNEPLVLLSSRAPAASMRSPWRAHRIGDARLFEWTSASGVHTVVGSRAGTSGAMRAAELLMDRQDMQWNAS